jgi:hypothetical protein
VKTAKKVPDRRGRVRQKRKGDTEEEGGDSGGRGRQERKGETGEKGEDIRGNRIKKK